MAAGGLQVYGTERMRRLGAELKMIGGPTARGLRANGRKAIIATATPMRSKIQAGYRRLPSAGGGTGLGEALAAGTKLKVIMGARTGLVRVFVDPKARHGDGLLGNLPAFVEGSTRKKWFHPVYARGGTRADWNWSSTAQPPHPTFYPIARRGEAEARVAAVLAVRETLAQLPKVIP